MSFPMKQTSISDLIQGDLGFESDYVENLAKEASDFYKTVYIDDRQVNVPSAELKLVQCWISDFIRTVNPDLPKYVTAYERKSSITKNAFLHQDNAHILNLDIKDFFHSCNESMVRSVFTSLKGRCTNLDPVFPLKEEDINLLTNLACYKRTLSVGSPCSPAIANRIMIPVDKTIISNLPSYIVYSRYSDDMTFSSNKWIEVDTVAEVVSSVLESYGFRLNRTKTKCSGKGDKRLITGVFLMPDGSLSIGSKRKRELKKSLYQYLVAGQGNPAIILGRIYFAISVEPAWAARLLEKYADYGLAKGKGVIEALRSRVGK